MIHTTKIKVDNGHFTCLLFDKYPDEDFALTIGVLEEDNGNVKTQIEMIKDKKVRTVKFDSIQDFVAAIKNAQALA